MRSVVDAAYLITHFLSETTQISFAGHHWPLCIPGVSIVYVPRFGVE